MKTVTFFIFVFLVLFSNNVAFATLQDQYNQVLQKPSYNCHNGSCLPTGQVQGNNLIDPITHLPSCVGSGCNGELNPCEGKGYGGGCDEALSQEQWSVDQTVQPLKVEMRLLTPSPVLSQPFWVGCEAHGGVPPYIMTLSGPAPLWGASSVTVDSNFGEIGRTMLASTSAFFTCNVQDSTGVQASNSTTVFLSNGSTNIGSSSQDAEPTSIVSSITHPDQYCCGHFTTGDEGNTQNNYQATTQNAGQQIQSDNSFWLDLVVGLGVAICIAIVGIVTLKFWTAVRIHAQQRERDRERGRRASNRSAIGNNSENIEPQIQREPFFTDEWFRNLQNQFPRDYARILDWVKRNPDETRKIRQVSENEKQEQRRIVKAWKDEVKSIKCTCGATFSEEDKYISHLKKTGHEGL